MLHPKRLFLEIVFLAITLISSAQDEWLIIGRTTGQLSFDGKDTIRCFGFSNSLSGQITLPGVIIEANEGDSIEIDFWNISQGDPHSLSITGIELLQKNTKGIYEAKKEEVHHMDHGFYKFHAKEAGTHIYYSSKNTSFSLQAGMFGLVIIQPKTPKKINCREVIWCSNEIDSTWHSNYLLDYENEFRSAKPQYPKYKPQYYLINGQEINQNQGLELDPSIDTNQVMLRLANTGTFSNLITFPKNVTISHLSGNSQAITKDKNGTHVHLEPLETVDILVQTNTFSKNTTVLYRYADSNTGKTKYKVKLPLFSQSLNQ